jgi:hypothetical protein
LYQKSQQDAILNVPELVTRILFITLITYLKKHCFLQTGITLNYFTKYFANDYNPVIGEFFIQDKKEMETILTLTFLSMRAFKELEFI